MLKWKLFGKTYGSMTEHFIGHYVINLISLTCIFVRIKKCLKKLYGIGAKLLYKSGNKVVLFR